MQGSLRVTDTTYTNDLNIASLTASQGILTDANKNLVSQAVSPSSAWTNGTTSGPVLKITVLGSTQATGATIPSASISVSGVVNTTTQRFRGEKQLEYPTITNNNSQYLGFRYKNNALTMVGEHWYDVGNNVNITKGQYYWRQYSPNSTANTTTTGFYEDYSLPNVTSGLTANKTYSILTTKDMSFSITGNAATASKLVDSNNTAQQITASYNSGGVTSFSYATVWNGYHLTYISKTDLMTQIRDAASGLWGISITGKAGSVDWANTGHPSTFPPSSHTHYELATIGDKRNENTTPNTYANRLIFQGLKTNSNINSPYTDTYSYLVGLRGWSDSSGGNSHELAFNGNGIYRRQGATTSWGNWYQILDSSNYTSYTVTKTGSGASGSWGISVTGSSASCTGNAATATRINGNLPAVTDNVNRNIVLCGDSGNGIGGDFKYASGFYYNASTKILTMPSGSKISCPSFTGNAATASAVKDSGNSTSTTFAYSKTGMNYADYTWLAGWNGYELRAVNKSQFLSTTAGLYHGSIGSSNHALALKGYFDSNKATIPRNQLLAYYSSSYSNGSICFGYWLMGYDANPYGGFYVCNYTTPYYVGISNGSYYEYKLWKSGDAVTGAVWNDYAEFRNSECKEFGYVVMETGKDTLTKTTERLSHFAGVTSDTWGFSQGETDTAKTPLAVAGRVLVYTYKDRNEYKPGDCVCAAPDGTVDIMTRDEVVQFPDRIVGTVSCVPDYEEWGGGENADRDPVKVNGRIWIKVR